MKISKELKIGVIAIISIIAFYWLFKFLQGENLFTKGKVVYATYNDVDGLLPTKPVNVNGLRVGRVDDIIIMEGNDSLYFVVKMIIEHELDFTVNTVAEIYEPGLMAGKMIKLNLSYDGRLAKSGDTLVSASKQSLMNMITDRLAPTQNRIDSVLISLNAVLDHFGTMTDEETNQSLKSVLRQLDATIFAIGQTANSLTATADNTNALVSNTNQNIESLTSDAQTLIGTTNSTIEKYGDVAEKINESNLDQTLNEMNEAIASLNQTLQRIESSDGTLNKIINDPELYDNLNRSSENLNILMQDLKERPDRYVQFSVFGKKHKESKKDQQENPDN